MPNKDFENFELRLVKLREESHEDFIVADTVFAEQFNSRLEDVFPRDVLWAKKYIAWSFAMTYVDQLHAWEAPDTLKIFKQVIPDVIRTLPLNRERQDLLSEHILQATHLSESLDSNFEKKDDISRDPFFALVEDFAANGDISKEEFIILKQSYSEQWNFLLALESLPKDIREMFHSHIEMTASTDYSSKKSEFESEFSDELNALKESWVNIDSVVIFVSRSYYKTPGKFKKFEHSKRRMRRTFKVALLRLLRAKLWCVDAQIYLDKFEAGEDFKDFFKLFFELLEVVSENPEGKEVFTLLNLDEDIQAEVFTAEENKQKILEGESMVMKIASLFSKWDASKDKQELADGMLDKFLDESTDIVGDDVYFNRQEEHSGVYAESTLAGEWVDEEEIDYDAMSPETAHEILKREFHKIEDKKRQAFLEWRYDDIDIYNDWLLWIQSKLEKLSQLLGWEI
jgi:hypothetical protein